MGLASKLQFMDLRSSFLAGGAAPLAFSFPSAARRPLYLPFSFPSSLKAPAAYSRALISSKLQFISTDASTSVATVVEDEDIESLFSDYSSEQSEISYKRGHNKGSSGASNISSGVRLENVSKSYKGVTVLKNINWEVKKREKVGLVGVNGAGKTTQLRIISGLEEPDSGKVIKAKSNMKISFLSQEFEVVSTRTVGEEFLSAFKEEMEIAARLEKVQKAIEKSVDDLELMGRLLDEFDLLQRRAQAVGLDEVDVILIN